MGKREIVKLPTPSGAGTMSLEEAILKRRSVRRFTDEALTLEDVSQLLWAAQGVTSVRGFRAAPSAGARYPLETYVVAGAVVALPSGIYRYQPADHALVKVIAGDKRRELASACAGQRMLEQAPVTFVFTAAYERMTGRYGERGFRYVHLDAGHAAENLHLQAVALGLGAVPIGAFDDNALAQVLGSPEGEQALYAYAVGSINA